MFVAEKKSIAMSLLFPPVSCSLTSSIKSKPLTKCQHFFGRTDSTMTDPSQPRPPGSYFRAPLTALSLLFAHLLLFIYRMFIFQCSSIFVNLLNLESCISPVEASHIVHIPQFHCASLVPGSLSLVCVFSLKADVSLSSSLESSSPHQYVCALFIPPPQQQRQQGQDPSIKQSWMGPCEATFPSFWTWYLLSADSGLFKGSQHSCRPPQIWDKAALAAPTTHTHTHPHTLTHIQYTSGQTHLQPLSCMCVFVCWYINDLALTFNNAAVVQYIGEPNH